jgi:hypothetical protein
MIQATSSFDGPPITFHASINGLAIYLDTFSLVELAKGDPARRRRFLDAIRSGADIVFSLANVAEVSGFQGKSLEVVRRFLRRSIGTGSVG